MTVNCEGCIHKDTVSRGEQAHCYMFKEKPSYCGRNTFTTSSSSDSDISSSVIDLIGDVAESWLD